MPPFLLLDSSQAQAPSINFLPWFINPYTDVIRSSGTDYTFRCTNPSTNFNTGDLNGRGFAPYAIAKAPQSGGFRISCRVSLPSYSSNVVAGIATLDEKFNKLTELGLSVSSSSINTVPTPRLSPPRTASSDLELAYNVSSDYMYTLYNGEDDSRIGATKVPVYIVLFMRGVKGTCTANFTNVRTTSLSSIPSLNSIFYEIPTGNNYVVVENTTTDAKMIAQGTATFSNCMTLCNTTDNCKSFEYSHVSNSCTLRQTQEFIKEKDVYSDSDSQNTVNNVFYETHIEISPNNEIYPISPRFVNVKVNRQFGSKSPTNYAKIDQVTDTLYMCGGNQSDRNQIKVFTKENTTSTPDYSFTNSVSIDQTKARMVITSDRVILFDGTSVKFFDKTSKSLLKTAGGPILVDFDINKSGTKLYCLYPGTIDILNVYDTNWTQIIGPGTNSNPNKNITVSQTDETCFAVSYNTYNIAVYKNSTIQTTLTVPFNITTLQFDPSGIYLATGGTPSNKIKVFRKLAGGTFQSSNTFTTEFDLTVIPTDSKLIRFSPLNRDLIVLSAYPPGPTSTWHMKLNIFKKLQDSEPDRFISTSPSLKTNLYMKFDISTFHKKFVFSKPLYHVIRDSIHIKTLVVDASGGSLDFLIVCEDKADIVSGGFGYQTMTYPRNSGTPRIGFRFSIRSYGTFYLLTNNLNFDDVVILNNNFENVFELDANRDVTFTKMSVDEDTSVAINVWKTSYMLPPFGLSKSRIKDRLFDVSSTLSHKILTFTNVNPTNTYALNFGQSVWVPCSFSLQNYKVVFKRSSDNLTVAILMILTNYDTVMVYTDPSYRTFFDFSSIDYNVLFSVVAGDSYYRPNNLETSFLRLDNGILNVLNSIEDDAIGSVPGGIRFTNFPPTSEELLFYKKTFSAGTNNTVYFQDEMNLVVNGTYTYRYYIYYGYVIYINDFGVINVLCARSGDTTYRDLYRVIYLGNFWNNTGQNRSYDVFGPYTTSSQIKTYYYTSGNAERLTVDLNNNEIIVNITIGGRGETNIRINYSFFGFSTFRSIPDSIKNPSSYGGGVVSEISDLLGISSSSSSSSSQSNNTKFMYLTNPANTGNQLLLYLYENNQFYFYDIITGGGILGPLTFS